MINVSSLPHRNNSVALNPVIACFIHNLYFCLFVLFLTNSYCFFGVVKHLNHVRISTETFVTFVSVLKHKSNVKNEILIIIKWNIWWYFIPETMHIEFYLQVIITCFVQFPSFWFHYCFTVCIMFTNFCNSLSFYFLDIMIHLSCSEIQCYCIHLHYNSCQTKFFFIDLSGDSFETYDYFI